MALCLLETEVKEDTDTMWFSLLGLVLLAGVTVYAGVIVRSTARRRTQNAAFLMRHDREWGTLSADAQWAWLYRGLPPSWQMPDAQLANFVGPKRIQQFRRRETGCQPPSPYSAAASSVAWMLAPCAGSSAVSRYSPSTSWALTRSPVAAYRWLARATAAHPWCQPFPPRIHPPETAPGTASPTLAALCRCVRAFAWLCRARAASCRASASSRLALARS